MLPLSELQKGNRTCCNTSCSTLPAHTLTRTEILTAAPCLRLPKRALSRSAGCSSSLTVYATEVSLIVPRKPSFLKAAGIFQVVSFTAVADLTGAMLPKGWRCEVIPRKCQLPVRGQDVIFSSPEGDSFRSTLDVYKHLRLNPHLPKGTKKRKEHPEVLVLSWWTYNKSNGSKLQLLVLRKAYQTSYQTS